MTERVLMRPWNPDVAGLPAAAEADKVYVLPTRYAAGGAAPRKVLYTDMVRYVPKEARAAGYPVEFSISKKDRAYLSEYSIDPITLAIALACIGPINDWIILTVDLFLRNRGKLSGYSEGQTAKMPLRVSVAEMDLESKCVKGIEIEGPGDDVLEALKQLKNPEA